MRTTIVIDDKVFKSAKQLAAREGMSLARLIENALAAWIRNFRGSGNKTFTLDLFTKHCEIAPGVQLEDRDSLYEFLERKK